MYVNGQIVKATIDGMSVPISLAMRRLRNGSAIPAALAPFQHLQGFSFESNGLGTFSVNIPGYRFYNSTGGGSVYDDDEPAVAGSQADYPAQNFSFSFGAALSGQTKQQTQQPEPKTPKGVKYSADRLDPLRNAFREALDRLKTSKCAELFTSWLKAFRETNRGILNNEEREIFDNVFDNDPSRVLQNIEFRLLPLKSPRVTKDANGVIISIAVTGAQTNSRNSVFINTQHGIFFDRTQTIEGVTKTFNLPGTASLTQTQFAALLLLHELGHAYGEIDGNLYFFGPDSASRSSNAEHSQAIIDACFPELNQTGNP